MGDKIAFHKIIAGLWLIESCRREWEREGLSLDYSEITQAAAAAEPMRFFFDPDDPRFMNPPVMTELAAAAVLSLSALALAADQYKIAVVVKIKGVPRGEGVIAQI
ncbi:MAG: hypothetical protein AB1700_07205 [Bacillota bacterium]